MSLPDVNQVETPDMESGLDVDMNHQSADRSGEGVAAGHDSGDQEFQYDSIRDYMLSLCYQHGLSEEVLVNEWRYFYKTVNCPSRYGDWDRAEKRWNVEMEVWNSYFRHHHGVFPGIFRIGSVKWDEVASEPSSPPINNIAQESGRGRIEWSEETDRREASSHPRAWNRHRGEGRDGGQRNRTTVVDGGSLRQHRGKKLRKFLLFAKLPLEIRIRIWNAALVPRIIRLPDDGLGFWNHSVMSIPGAFHACQESRLEAQYFFRPTDLNQPGYLMSVSDLIHVKYGDLDLIRAALDGYPLEPCQGSIFRSVQRILFHWSDAIGLFRWSDTIGLGYVYKDVLRRGCPCLKEIIVVVSESMPSSFDDLYEVSKCPPSSEQDQYVQVLREQIQTRQQVGDGPSVKLTLAIPKHLERWWYWFVERRDEKGMLV